MVMVIGAIGILLTVSAHAVVAVALVEVLKRLTDSISRYQTTGRAMLVAFSATTLAIKHGLDILCWGVPYWLLARTEFSNFEDAVYFASTTYTTVGYGDLVVSGPWRLLGTFVAIDGLLLFGFSTALLFVLFDYLWLHPESPGGSSSATAS